MLAVVKASERFHIYLYGLSFTVVTDCHALVYAVNKAHLNLRIARWILRLQNYRFQVAHRAGRKMLHVDALSRISAYVNAIPLERELEYRQLQDAHLKEIAQHLENADHEKYELVEGLVYRKCSDKPRFVVPEVMINNVIRVYHDDMTHCGLKKTLRGIQSNYWFPAMVKRVRDYLDNCLTCLMSNSSTNSREGELQISDTPTKPFQVLHADHFGPLTETAKGFKHILIIIDAVTRFTWVIAVKSTSAKESIKHFTSLFNIFGHHG